MASAVALMTLGRLLARGTLAFGPAESFWVAMFGLASISVMVGSDVVEGLIAAVLQLLIGTVGLDPSSGQARFSFGRPVLLGGLDLIVILVGLYALPPVLQLAERADLAGMTREALRLADVRLGWSAVRAHWRTWARSPLIDIGVGLLPGAGGIMAAFSS